MCDKKQVDKELISRHLQPKLPPDKSKASTELHQKAGDVANQAVFNLALARVAAQAEKVEQVASE